MLLPHSQRLQENEVTLLIKLKNSTIMGKAASQRSLDLMGFISDQDFSEVDSSISWRHIQIN